MLQTTASKMRMMRFEQRSVGPTIDYAATNVEHRKTALHIQDNVYTD